MKHEVDFTGDVIALPIVRREVDLKRDLADAARNIAMAESRIRAEQVMEEQMRAERERQPYCTASRSDFIAETVLAGTSITIAIGALTAVAALII